MMTDTNTANSTETKKTFHIPLADIYETEDIYSVKLEMAGIKKENLDIVIDDDELKITAESSPEENAGNLKYAEFRDRNFSRTFRVGSGIDRNKIDAKLENGILTLTLHKSEAVKPKKITINQIN
jgi:HSP20 family protein